MKIAIIGGGPAGLYAAILLRKQRPEAEIAVYERNRADDTFGFGVVFSDATLDNFEKYDPPSYRRITQEFAYWDDIAVHFRGTVHRVGGNGFCGCSRRKLLLILQERARELGVRLQFEVEIDNEARFADADLIILADGINSRFREKHIDHFEPEVDIRSNQFAWMGSTRPLDAFTFIFQETEWGPFIAHAYQYEAGRSTWIFETDPATFERAGLKGLDEKQSADRMAQIFGWFLGSHQLLTNRSMWRNFPMIRSKRWVKDNMVLVGDAKAISRSARAPSLRWKTPSRWPKPWNGRRRSRRRSRNMSRGGARRSRRPSMRPMSHWSGSSMLIASGSSIRCSSRSA
jgi:anthraniloyl-CoA monooxygenase